VDAGEHLRPRVAEDRLEQLFLRLEVVVDEAVGDTGLLGDVSDPRRVEATAREDLDGRFENLAPTVGLAFRARGHLRATLNKCRAGRGKTLRPALLPCHPPGGTEPGHDP